MNSKIEAVLEEIQEISGYLWDKGWAERNGGNISVNMTEEYEGVAVNLERCKYIEYCQLDHQLAGKVFFTSGTGLRIRDMAKSAGKLRENSCILKVNDKANGYYIIWGGEKTDFNPTSELISHFKIHLDLIKRKTSYKAIVHTHPHELIALTHSKDYCKSSEQVSDQLWRMLPEVRAFVPKGIGLVLYELPSSEKLADKTVEVLKHYNVALWEKHGALAAGRDVAEAFDFVDVANKGAEIFFKCLSAGFIPEGMNDRQMKELEETFNLN
ncbi:MAG: rhamnulose-1-phosphate aldolase [Victivallales bacterium]|nr:rhamnulose-1-phosphate aldolase [Victivallales bacterium]MCF7889105.1 rhamnulose-1-phosphate aldolase [Victivallales bacterium]